MATPSLPPSQQGAPFNMAIDSLMRLGEILRDIKVYSSRTDIPLEQRQAIKIGLVRQFFFQAVPLLKGSSDEFIKEYEDKVMSLNPMQRPLYERKMGGSTHFVGYKTVYNPMLENQLDKILMVVQQEMQKQNYFMPAKTDLRYSWSHEK